MEGAKIIWSEVYQVNSQSSSLLLISFLSLLKKDILYGFPIIECKKSLPLLNGDNKKSIQSCKPMIGISSGSDF